VLLSSIVVVIDVNCSGASDEQHAEAKDKLAGDKTTEVLTAPKNIRQYISLLTYLL